jgi:hypothetical protein
VPTFDKDKYQKEILVPAVDAFIKSGALPDAFERYALPLEASDPGEIQQALKSVNAFWSKTKNNEKFGSLLRVLLAENKETERELLDQTARDALREIVKGERKKKQEARFAELDIVIRLGASKGYLRPEEKQSLLAKFTALGLTEPEILSRIKVPVEERMVKPPEEGLDLATRRTIGSNLAVLKKPDLYAFLELTPTASKEELASRHEELSLEWRKKKDDHNKIAANALLSAIQNKLLKEGLGKYEQALVWDAIDHQLRAKVEFAAFDRRISREAFEILIGHGTKCGISKSQTIEAILWLAYEKGVVVENSELSDTVVCAGCYSSVARTNNKCTSCGAALWTACPKCKTKNPASDAACGNCGFVTADRHRVDLLIRKVDFALAEKDLEVSLKHAREAERIWGRADDVENILRKVEALIKQAELLRKNYDGDFSHRKVFSARNTLAQLASISLNHKGWDGKTPEQLQRELDAQIQKAEQLLERGRAYERDRNTNEAVRVYQEILSIAADHAEAENGLKRCPPEPAKDVQTKVYDGKIVVEWKASVAVGNLEYLLVRCEGRIPVSPSDGTLVASVSNTSFCDEGVPPASFVFYGVFTDRGGVHSSAAVSEGLLALKEVDNCSLEVGDASVRGHWDFSVPAGKVRVVCGSEESLRQGKGRPLQLSNPHGFEDSGLDNGKTYTYRIFVEYHYPNGKTEFTGGRYVSATPTALPSPVDRLSISASGGQLHFQWTPPPFGIVSIYRLLKEPEWKCGTQVSPASLSQLGSPLRNTRDGRAIDLAPSTGRVYYTPFSIAGDAAVVGQAKSFITAEEISDLEAEDFESYLLLRWKWARSFKSVVVAWRHDDYPEGAQDPRATTQKVTRGEYDANGGFRIPQPEARPYKFVVYTVAELDGQTVYSSGLNRDCRSELRSRPAIKIKYELKTKGWRQKKIVVSLISEEALSFLPELCLVAKRGQTQPLTSQEGTIIARIKHTQTQPLANFEYEFDLPLMKRPFFLRLFFAAPDAYHSFRLLDPSPSQSKVS